MSKFKIGQLWEDRNGDEWEITSFDDHDVLPMNIIGRSKDVAGEESSLTIMGKVAEGEDYDGDLVRLVFQGSSLPPIVIGQVWADRAGRKWIVTAVGSSKDLYPVAVTPEDGGDYDEEADKSRTITGKTVTGDCAVASDLIKLVKDAPASSALDTLIARYCYIPLDTTAPEGRGISRKNEEPDHEQHYLGVRQMRNFEVGQIWEDRNGDAWVITSFDGHDVLPMNIVGRSTDVAGEESSRTAMGEVSNAANYDGDLVRYVTKIQPAAKVDGWDKVDAPKHYNLPGLGLEWIDVRASLLKTIPDGINYEAVTSWSEAITYLARMWGKNDVEDARKAEFYIKRLITLLVDL